MLFHRVAAVIAIDKALYEVREEALTGRWFPRTAAHCQRPTGTPCPWKRSAPCFSCHPFSSSSIPAPYHPDCEFIRGSTSSTQSLKFGSTSVRAPWRTRSSVAVDGQGTATAGVDPSEFGGLWDRESDGWLLMLDGAACLRLWTMCCCWVKFTDTPLICKYLTIWPSNFIHYLIISLTCLYPAKCASTTNDAALTSRVCASLCSSTIFLKFV